jgi:hypothetical protein
LPGVLLQNFFFLDIPIQINGAAFTGTVAESVPKFSHIIARPPGNLVSRALFLFLTVENVPAGGQNHEIAETGKGETPFVNQIVDLSNLRDIETGVQAVIGVFFSNGLDKAFFLIFPDALLGEIHHPGDVVDEKEVSYFHLFVFSPRHKSV